MSCYPKVDIQVRDKFKVVLDFSIDATKKEHEIRTCHRC